MNAKKWKVVAPLALSAAGALAAAAAVLLKKPVEEKNGESKGKAVPKGKAAPAKALKSGSYSFISGYKNAATVELTLDYDPEKYSFTVVEDEFLCSSGDSHVAIVYGEDFNLQLEYAAFYGGEDFSAHSKSMAERYQSFREVRYGANEGIQYVDGDTVCLNLAIPGDGDSYVLVSIIKLADDDEELSAIVRHPELSAMLESLRYQISR